MYPTKLPTKIKGKLKTFYDKNRLEKIVTSKSVLQKIPEEILQSEEDTDSFLKVYREWINNVRTLTQKYSEKTLQN